MEKDKVSIVILNKSNNECLIQLLESIKTINTYRNIEIIIGDTGSSDEEIEELKKYLYEYKICTIKFIQLNFYHFAKCNNFLVREYVSDDSKYILFCNNDIRLLNDAISSMVQKHEDLEKEGIKVGTVGAVLLFDDNTIQHYGIMAYYDGVFSHIGYQKKLDELDDDYLKVATRLYCGNTFAFCLCSVDTFNEIGGLNEEYNICFEDVEFNLACLKKGYSNSMSKGICYHYESKTRGKSFDPYDEDKVKQYFLSIFMNDKE